MEREKEKEKSTSSSCSRLHKFDSCSRLIYELAFSICATPAQIYTEKYAVCAREENLLKLYRWWWWRHVVAVLLWLNFLLARYYWHDISRGPLSDLIPAEGLFCVALASFPTGQFVCRRYRALWLCSRGLCDADMCVFFLIENYSAELTVKVIIQTRPVSSMTLYGTSQLRQSKSPN